MSGRLLNLDWMRDAACANDPDPDSWHPDTTRHGAADRARRICKEECPVINDCFEYWLSLPTAIQREGVWFGQSRYQRTMRGMQPKTARRA